MTTPSVDQIESILRAGLDAKITSARALADAFATRDEARARHAEEDAANVAAVDAAVKQARTAGLDDNALKELGLFPFLEKAPAKKPSTNSAKALRRDAAGRGTAATTAAAPKSSQDKKPSPPPPANPPLGTVPEPSTASA
ncbi:hypothetical protein ACFVVM_32715 [Nocardia sp. NPDC058176]|uniref:hypothetical protein n=1 Tax=Nocardia sp. NPDC058176 TaxID=3346368 RepID=UPI0036DBDCF9